MIRYIIASTTDKMRLMIRLGIAILIIILVIYIFFSNSFKITSQRLLYGDKGPRFTNIFSNKDGISQYADGKFHFDPNGDAIIVILHIQKTGGTTFEEKVVTSLNVTPQSVWQPRKRRYDCLNNKGHVWIVSGQYSLKWPCSLHADYTEFHECIDGYFDKREKLHRDRRYLYVTILREPIKRYLSEWKNIQRGSTWVRYERKEKRCNHRKVTNKELPKCFKVDWINVTLDDFMDCPHNLAINRQTRMLANLSLVNCYNTSAMPKQERDRIMLESAKNNLKNMAFFGLTEFQELNQYLFEYTFGISFIKDFSQRETTNAAGAKTVISPSQYDRIKELNNLDIELYEYARHLYFERIEQYNLKGKQLKMPNI